MINFNDTIGNRNRELPACSAVLQPTAPPHAPTYTHTRARARVCVCMYIYLYLYIFRVLHGSTMYSYHTVLCTVNTVLCTVTTQYYVQLPHSTMYSYNTELIIGVTEISYI